MEFKEDFFEGKVKGFLEIYISKDDGPWELHTAEENVILDNYRINLTDMAIDDDGIDTTTGDYMFRDLIPHRIVFDDGGSRILSNGEEDIITPDGSTEVDISSPMYFSHLINEKVKGYKPNIALMKIHINKGEANQYVFSRATLKSLNNKSIATKCFESIDKKESWDVYFRWSIAY